MASQLSFPTEIDNTIRSTFRDCQRKVRMRFLQMRSPAKPNVHLHAGGAFAAGLDRTRMAYFAEGATAEDAVAQGWAELIAVYGDFEVTDDRVNKTAHRMGQALVSYFDEYPLGIDPLEPYRPHGGKPAVEFNFALPLPINHPETGAPILYCGRFDMLGVMNGQVFVVDEKTTSALGPSWVKRYELSAQFTGYCWAVRELGYPSAGAIVRGIGILKNEIKHVSVPLLRPQFLIDEWYDALLADINAMIECWRTDTWRPDFNSACGGYGGCPYSGVCSSPPNVRDSLLQIDFVENRWSPLKGEGDE